MVNALNVMRVWKKETHICVNNAKDGYADRVGRTMATINANIARKRRKKPKMCDKMSLIAPRTPHFGSFLGVPEKGHFPRKIPEKARDFLELVKKFFIPNTAVVCNPLFLGDF